MLMLPSSVRIYIAAESVDLRAGFDRLAMHVRRVVREDPLNGHLFVFFNRRMNRVKVLWWDRTGWSLLYRRLEVGTFRIPNRPRPGERHVEVTATELGLILEGIDLSQGTRRRRWCRLPHEHGSGRT